MLGSRAVANITARVPKLDQNATTKDRLIWFGSKTGAYSAKVGYDTLMKGHGSNTSTNVVDGWSCVWGLKDLEPKVKVFIWRALNGGLPVAANMHRRIQGISPTCQRCHGENEFETHMFFFCQTSRAVWFGCNLAIRVHNLPLGFKEAFTTVLTALSDASKVFFCNTLWNIWKARNKEVIEGKKFNPMEILAHTSMELQLKQLPISTLLARRCVQRYDIPPGDYICLCDASWDNLGRAGVGVVIYGSDKRLMFLYCYFTTATDAFMAEIMAVQGAIQHCLHFKQLIPQANFHIFTDCSNVVRAVAGNINWHEWTCEIERGLQLIAQQWQQSYDWLQIRHARREIITPAHALATTARRDRLYWQGPPTYFILHNLNIAETLNDVFVLG